MNKKIITSVLAALMIAGSTSFTAFAAMTNGTVVIGTKAFDLNYANDATHAAEIGAAIVAGGGVYVKDFTGKWINNTTGAVVDASVIPAVTYKSATGVVTDFAVGDKDAVAGVAVTSVSAITNYGVDVKITALDKDLLGATIVVKDNTGKTIAVKPVDVASGDTTVSFDFATAITGDMVGTWTFDGVSVDFDYMAKLEAVYNADSQIGLYNALNTLGILNVKDANIQEYEDALDTIQTTVDLKDFTKAMAQNLVTTTNTTAITADEEKVIVEAVTDAITDGNQIALLKALQNPAFERVNAAWIEDYVVPTTENSIVEIQGMINTANMVKVEAAVKTSIDGIDRTVLTASKTLITTYATPDAKGAQTTTTIAAIKAINIQLAVADVVAATTPTTLKAKLNALATLVNPKTGTPVLDMTKYVETSSKLYITEIEGKTTVPLLITAIDTVNTEVNSRVTVENFNVMDVSGVKGYTVGFNFNGARMDMAKKVVINLYKGTTLLATATSSGLLENLPTAITTYQSAPFDVFGNFNYVEDGNWTYSGWNGAVTDIPTRAETIVTFNDGIVTTTEDEDFTETPEENTSIFIVETVNAATDAIGVNAALLALGDDNYLKIPSVDRLYVANLVLEARDATPKTKEFATLEIVQIAVENAITAHSAALEIVNGLTSTDTNITTIPVLKEVGNETFNEMTKAEQATIAENFLNKCDFSGIIKTTEKAGALKTPFKTLAAIIGLMK